MLKLKFPYIVHPMGRANSLEKAPMLARLIAGEGDDRGPDRWMSSLTQWT